MMEPGIGGIQPACLVFNIIQYSTAEQARPNCMPNCTRLISLILLIISEDSGGIVVVEQNVLRDAKFCMDINYSY